MDKNLGRIRTEYLKGKLTETKLPEDPLRLFDTWMAEALTNESAEPTAMTLSTADSHGIPSSRIVLLKGLENGEFLFFSNYQSRKGRELSANPHAALLFFWPLSERQVRITGSVRTLSSGESFAYFRTRPYESRIGAHASRQSEVIPDRTWLEDRVSSLEQKYPEGTDIPLPENWGGYAVYPKRIEFWQGREGRLHDRIEYLRNNGNWAFHRLSP